MAGGKLYSLPICIKNHVVYPFKGLYLSVKTGRATFKGFRRLEALQRLNAYKDGVLKGYMGDSQTLFEEL